MTQWRLSAHVASFQKQKTGDEGNQKRNPEEKNKFSLSQTPYSQNRAEYTSQERPQNLLKYTTNAKTTKIVFKAVQHILTSGKPTCLEDRKEWHLYFCRHRECRINGSDWQTQLNVNGMAIFF